MGHTGSHVVAGLVTGQQPRAAAVRVIQQIDQRLRQVAQGSTADAAGVWAVALGSRLIQAGIECLEGCLASLSQDSAEGHGLEPNGLWVNGPTLLSPGLGDNRFGGQLPTLVLEAR